MTASDNTELQQKLEKRLYKLQEQSAAVQTLVAKTNQREYENLASIYLWWREASTIDGYLEAVLERTKLRRVKNHVNDGTNFRRLLYLMYGNYGLLKDDLERKNAVLCGLHTEYEKNHQLYIKDAVNKLAGYIKAQGGMNGIISQQAALMRSTDDTALADDKLTSEDADSQTGFFDFQFPEMTGVSPTSKSRIEVKITNGMRQRALLDEAIEYFSKQNTSHQVSVSPPLATNADGFGIAIFKRNNRLYNIIGATDHTQSVRELLVSSYRKQFAALPASMRCFFETIKTQTLPQNLQKMYDKLTELSSEKHDDNTKKKIRRRLMYVASENTLVLSPTYSTSGVVTLAKLKGCPFENGSGDCFMPTRCRKVIEQRMLATDDYNLFTPAHLSVVPEFHVQGLASHILRLDSKADKGDFVFVDFWQFESQMGAATGQLYFASSYINRCPTKLCVSKDDMQTFAFDHIDKWLDSYGDHITRPANQVVKLGISEVGFEFGFDWVNKVYRNHTNYVFMKSQQQPVSYKATFLAKDLCLALHSAGSLPLTSDVEIACSDDALILCFSTEVADYTVVVPTTEGTKRKTDAFCIYTAQCVDHEGVSGIEPSTQDDLSVETSLEKKNSVPTDRDIERMLVNEPDDYTEILEGWGVQTRVNQDGDDIEWITTEQ